MKPKRKVAFADVVEATRNPDSNRILGLDIGMEFDRNFYNTQSFDLSRFGLSWIPVVSRMCNSRYATPSPWHVHEECIEIICCTHGMCEYETRQGTVRLLPGGVFVSRPDEPHRQLTNPRRFSTYCLFVRLPKRERANSEGWPDAMVAWFVSRLRKVPRSMTIRRESVNRFGRIFRIFDDNGMRPLERKIRLQEEIVAFLLDVVDAAEAPSSGSRHRKVESVAKEMSEHPERDYSIDWLVSHLAMSPTAILTAFRQTTGFAPHAYLIKCRIDRAKGFLSRGMGVAKTAAMLGFPSRRHFTSMFLKATGHTPQEWKSGDVKD